MQDREDREGEILQVAERAAEARLDPEKFISFVTKPAVDKMREAEFFDPEDPLALLRVVPHQRVLMKFILHHELSVVMLPAEHGKTSTVAGLILCMIARDPTIRIMLVSATESQAKQTLKVISDNILLNPRFWAVAPSVRRGTNPGDEWTDTAITVQRPYGNRDPTIVAVGLDSKTIAGKRIDLIVGDDISNLENTGTKEQREKVVNQFFGIVRPRLVPGGRLVVCNTAMHPDDLPNTLKKRGWATLRMDILGNVWVYPNSVSHPTLPQDWSTFGLEGQPGADDLRDVCADDFRPTGGDPLALRLTGNDHEPEGRRTLWPDRCDEARVAELRKHLQFDQLYMNLARNDETQMCKLAYVETCKRVAQEMGVTSMVERYDGTRREAGGLPPGGITFTGVDLAFSQRDAADYVCFFTFVVLPSGRRVILDIEVGRFPVKAVVEKVFQKHLRYDSVVVVENNSAQDAVRQWALDHKYTDPRTGVTHHGISFPIQGYATGREKAHPEYGVASLFVEMSNGAWAIPNRNGNVHPTLQRFIDDCLDYTPSAHTSDILMAAFVARAYSKKYGVPDPPGTTRPSMGLTSR